MYTFRWEEIKNKRKNILNNYIQFSSWSYFLLSTFCTYKCIPSFLNKEDASRYIGMKREREKIFKNVIYKIIYNIYYIKDAFFQRDSSALFKSAIIVLKEKLEESPFKIYSLHMSNRVDDLQHDLN